MVPGAAVNDAEQCEGDSSPVSSFSLLGILPIEGLSSTVGEELDEIQPLAEPNQAPLHLSSCPPADLERILKPSISFTTVSRLPCGHSTPKLQHRHVVTLPTLHLKSLAHSPPVLMVTDRIQPPLPAISDDSDLATPSTSKTSTSALLVKWPIVANTKVEINSGLPERPSPSLSKATASFQVI